MNAAAPTERPTRFTDLVGCELPIQCAAMSSIADPRLAAAVADAGGLGMIGMGRRSAEVVGGLLDAADALTDRPVGAGFVVPLADPESIALAAERVPVIEFFWGEPDPKLAGLGPISGWQVGSVEEARAAVDAGCSFVVLQGVEAGGHVRGEIELDDLVAATRAALDDQAVLVAGGGVGTADDVTRLFDLGADAVRLGTRLVAAIESPAHDRYVQLLSAADDTDTELSEAFWIGWEDAPHRVLTSAVEASGEGPDVVGTVVQADGTIRKIPRFFVSPPTGDVDGTIEAMALYAGVGSTGPVDGRIAVATLVDELLAR